MVLIIIRKPNQYSKQTVRHWWSSANINTDFTRPGMVTTTIQNIRQQVNHLGSSREARARTQITSSKRMIILYLYV